LCGKISGLHIHHIDGNGERYSETPNHDLDNLITLCRSCHISISNLRTYHANPELVIRLITA
jgi:5-methylcytosine-specific restriction endonuclease McrA